ncbi:MAG TPA: YbaK/EbsC family protein [Trueperaceae bacterium]
MAKPSRSLDRVQNALEEHGLEVELQSFPDSTRTAEDAARAVGCEVAQIAKSLVFRSAGSLEQLLIVVSGANRVDLGKVGEQLGERLEMADAKSVRERTGFAVGGVPPLGHDDSLKIYLDRDLLGFELIWAAAGRPDAVFAVAPQELLRVTRAQVIDVR